VAPDYDAMANIDPNGWNQGYNPMAYMIWPYGETPGPTRYMTEDEVKGAKALQYFQLFFTPEVMQHILDETNGYANRQRTENPQNHRSKWDDLFMPELEIFLGMTLLMGIIRLPTYHMYFQTKHKLLVTNIADPMGRNRFLQIKRYLHVADETVADPDDKLRKVRPLLDLVTPHFAEEYVMNRETAIDEAMIPYKGRLNIKQYMSAKPTKWGIKVWCLNEASSGYGWRLQVYTGAAADGVPETNQATRVVLDLMYSLKGKGFHLYTDNLYTSPILASILWQNQIYCCGTIRVYPQPRRYFPRDIVVTKNQGKRLDRGNYVWRSNGPLIAMRWMDKKPVYLLSTIHPPHLGNGHLPNVRRFARDGEAHIIPAPPAEVQYVTYMRGVDRADQKIQLYNTGRKSVKWWKRVFYYLIEVSINNGHIIETKQREKYGIRKRSILDFKTALGEELLDGRSVRKKKGRPSGGMDDEDVARLDNTGHMPVYSENRHDCKVCNRKIATHHQGRVRPKNVGPGCAYFVERHRTQIRCEKCDVALCITKDRNCFRLYHTYQEYWRH
jgi:hypothetical protein